MRYEWLRYATFKTYPYDGPSTPSTLAAAGFYYTRRGTNVKCFSCGITNNVWPETETVMDTHRRISPTCQFVKGDLTYNIPIHSRQGNVPETGRSQSRYPHYESEISRTASFLSWPYATTFSNDFVACGLFYTGQNDLVRCYCCDVGLKEWLSGDCPWIAHVEYSPHCKHLLECKLIATLASCHQVSLSSNQKQKSVEKHPVYKNVKARILSFAGKATPNHIPLDKLVDAGFFYEGPSGGLRCYFCGVQLEAYSAEVDPFDEHLRCSPCCEHIRSGTNRRENTPEPRTPENATIQSEYRNDNVADVDDQITEEPNRQMYGGQSSTENDKVAPIFEPLTAIFDQIEKGSPPSPQPAMRYELLRLSTLRGYLKPYVTKLSEAGFYYASDVERPEVNEDVNNNWAPERNRRQAQAQHNRQNETGTGSIGIITALPKHTQYATKTARVASFNGWSDTASHTPQELADAGFFFTGFGDRVRCFNCGIGLRHWMKDDDPWIEHARWSRNCVHVKQKKGEEFVNLVQLAVQQSQDNETTQSYTSNTSGTDTLDVPNLVNDTKGNLQRSTFDLLIKSHISEISSKRTQIEEMKEEVSAARTQVEELGEESQKHQDRLLCKACLTNEINTVLLPYRHSALCTDCAGRVTTCVICRTKINSFVKMFLA